MDDMPRDDNDLVGQNVGQFKVLEEIGRGGMATVYRATQESINRDVALKVLPRVFLHDPGFFERFEREVDVIAHLEHPHIVPIYDYGKADGMPYIAMRYLSGGSLVRWIRAGADDIRDLVRPVSQIGQALDYAHAQGIIHRDLKPGNILLDISNNAYLSDFGIARVLNSDLTGSAIIGTPSYMSPEQANGEHIDARSDVYAFGIVIFELIAGREPFSAPTPIAMLLKQINERVPSLREFRREIPEEIDKVIAKATEKRPADRYGSAGELADAFAEAVRALPTPLPLPPLIEDRSETKPILDPSLEHQPTVTPAPMSGAEQAGDAPTLPPNKTDVPSKAEIGGPETTYGAAYDPPEVAATQKRKGRPRRRLIGIVGGVILIGLIGLAIANPFSPTPVPLAEAVPRYAEGLQIVDNGVYAFGIPADFTQLEAGNFDQTWQSPDETMQMAVRLMTADGSDMATAASRYMARYDENQILDVEQVDNYMRYSVRVGQAEDFATGQLDVYLAQTAAGILMIELYASDEIGNDAVATLQNMLRSVRVQAS